MNIEDIKVSAKEAKTKVTAIVESDKGQEVFRGFSSFCKTIVENKYVVNTLAAGFAGALVGYLTFLPISFCMTIAMILGLYNTVTK